MFRLCSCVLLTATGCSPLAKTTTQPERAPLLVEKHDANASSRARAAQNISSDSPADAGSELGAAPATRTAAEKKQPSLRACKPPAIEEASMVAPCSYTGRISARLEFFLGEQGGPILMSTLSTTELNVTRFELPNTAKGRIRITVSSPLHFDGWAHALDGTSALKTPVDIVKDHIRVPTTLPLHAFRVGHDAQVHVDFAPNAILPSSWSKLLSCDALTLPQPPPPARIPPDEPRLLVSGRIQLFDSPDGKRVGAVDSDGRISVSVLEKRQGWLRVSDSSPFEYDAWIRNSDAPEVQEFGMVGLHRTFSGQCSHSTAASLPLLMDHYAHEKPVAELPPSGQLLLDEQRSSKDFVAVAVPGVGPANPEHRFYVSRQLFEQIATPLP